jgi:heme/copper-type cytochrome/quinol oxidase subunit 4
MNMTKNKSKKKSQSHNHGSIKKNHAQKITPVKKNSIGISVYAIGSILGVLAIITGYFSTHPNPQYFRWLLFLCVILFIFNFCLFLYSQKPEKLKIITYFFCIIFIAILLFFLFYYPSLIKPPEIHISVEPIGLIYDEHPLSMKFRMENRTQYIFTRITTKFYVHYVHFDSETNNHAHIADRSISYKKTEIINKLSPNDNAEIGFPQIAMFNEPAIKLHELGKISMILTFRVPDFHIMTSDTASFYIVQSAPDQATWIKLPKISRFSN